MDHSIAEQADYYDRRWGQFTYANGLKLERCAAILAALAQTGIKEPQIIEVGCGTGWLTAVLGHFGPTLGVELSPLAVEEASRRHRHVRFRQVDLVSWDYPREAFDVMVSHEVIEHLEDQRQHLDMAHGLLRTGGHLILTTPNARTVRAMNDDQRASWSTQPIENWLTLGELRRLVQEPGFRIIALSTTILGFGRNGTYRLVNSVRIGSLLARLGLKATFDSACLRLGYGLHTVLCAKKVSGHH